MLVGCSNVFELLVLAHTVFPIDLKVFFFFGFESSGDEISQIKSRQAFNNKTDDSIHVSKQADLVKFLHIATNPLGHSPSS